MKPRTHYELIVDEKILGVYDHIVKAESSADYYFRHTGVMPTIKAYIKVR